MREVQFNNIVAIRALLFLYFHLNSLLAYYICTDFSNGRCPAPSRLLLLTTRHLLSWIYLVYLVDFIPKHSTSSKGNESERMCVEGSRREESW